MIGAVAYPGPHVGRRRDQIRGVLRRPAENVPYSKPRQLWNFQRPNRLPINFGRSLASVAGPHIRL